MGPEHAGNSPTHAKQMRLVFVDDEVAARADLLEAEAPTTCRELWKRLPFEGELIHGQWSGPETYLLIDPSIRIPPENQTFRVVPGDVGYYAVEGGRMYGWPDDTAELAFFYDRGARPSMIDGPVPVNLFARITENLEGFAAACRSIRREGVKRFRVKATGP